MRAGRSPYDGMFLTYDRVFPGGATEADLTRIARPRPGLPFTPVILAGQPRLAWTTFTSHQIDLDVRHPAARAYLTAVLRRLAGSGVTMVRLDAVGYAVKTAGTSCFMTPETMTFLGDITGEAHELGLQVLAEIHGHPRDSRAAAASVDRIYDFLLGPLILHALTAADARPLRDWLRRRPANCVTVLDTHDGIGMVDAGPGPGPGEAGLLTAAQIDTLVAAISRNSGGTSRSSSIVRGAGTATYQVSCTLYDAVGGDDRRHLLARLLQLFAPGIPQVYYVGLLAGHNQLGVRGDAREINRRCYTEAEVARELCRPVVRALAGLIGLRTTHPAFRGRFGVLDTPDGEIAMAWRADGARAELHAHLADASYRLTLVAGDERRTVTDVSALP